MYIDLYILGNTLALGVKIFPANHPRVCKNLAHIMREESQSRGLHPDSVVSELSPLTTTAQSFAMLGPLLSYHKALCLHRQLIYKGLNELKRVERGVLKDERNSRSYFHFLGGNFMKEVGF